jgi:hypothetical protein
MPLRGAKRWAYLTRQKTIRVATANEDGSIYLSPLWYVIQDQRIFVPLDAAARHVVNFEAHRPLSALVDNGEEYATVHGVRIQGSMALITDKKLLAAIDDLLFEKYFYVGHPYAESYFEFGKAAGRQVFELVPDKMIGWDMREVALPQVPEARVLPPSAKDRIL